MCMVSAVLGYGQNQWPYTSVPGVVIVTTPANPDPQAWEQFKKAVDAARVFDEQAKQAACESVEKDNWFKKMDERMQKLEEAIKNVSK